MRRWNLTLPWVEPLLVAALHAPLSAAWLAWLSPETGTMVYLAWKIVAFPLVAAASLIALSPAIWLIERNFAVVARPGNAVPNLAIALASAATAHFVFLQVPLYPFGLLGGWLLAILAALAFRRTITSMRVRTRAPAR